MILFTAMLKKYDRNGEKTGWTYIDVPAAIANEIYPGKKTSFRVKGKLDGYAVEQVAMVPAGSGNFIIAVNASMRKALGKTKGALIEVSIERDQEQYQLNKELLKCLADEPAALEFFSKLPLSHQRYFSNWIEGVKAEATRKKGLPLL